jgi:predicted aldo/keto reductase-like oxidoreductase
MRSPAEVAENVAAGTRAPLTGEEKRLVELVQKSLEGLGEEFCTACGYCQPCPEGVGVPGIFTLWNMQRGYGADSYTKLEYLKMREGRHWADYRGRSAEHCTECGECEEKCPNSLPVREMLKQAHRELT